MMDEYVTLAMHLFCSQIIPIFLSLQQFFAHPSVEHTHSTVLSLPHTVVMGIENCIAI